MSILLSAGHMPNDPGACSDSGKCEFEIANKWIHNIHYLILPFVDVGFVHRGTLNEKVDQINADPNVKVAIELHFNSNIKGAKGGETLYYPGSKQGKELAESIQYEFENNRLFLPNRGAKEGYYQQDKTKPVLYFLRGTKCVSVVIEPQFISNIEDIENNESDGCRAIADGILKFYYKEFGPIYDNRIS